MSRTVRVRVALAMDDAGRWFACGSDDTNLTRSMERAFRDVAGGAAARSFWLEAEVPIPEVSEPVTVQATVTEAEPEQPRSVGGTS